MTMKKINLPKYIRSFAFAAVISPAMLFSQFTTGNLVILQAGDGTGSLGNTGNPIVFKEYSTAGVATYSMMVPTTGTNALIMSGSATSEGYLSLSADGRYLAFAGYAQALPSTNTVATASGTLVNRGVGLVGGAGLPSYSLMGTSSTFFTSNNIRSASATGKDNVWAVGANQGTNYFGPASTPTIVQSTKVNMRATAVFNGQLYASSQVSSGSPTDIGVYMIGTGTPVTSGQTASCAVVTGTNAQPSQFYFNALGTICYVADARNSASGGGIQKWSYSGGSWSLLYTIATGASPGAFGVVADFSGINPIVYATTAAGGANSLIAISDLGASSTATVLATAPNNTNFRGLAFAPCSLPLVSLISNAPICAGETLSLSSSVLGGANTYTWSGAGNFGSVNVASTTVNNAANGVYTLNAENGCGVTSETINVVINPLPSVGANSITVCTGQPATLIATGANTYSWNTGGNSATLVVTPAGNTTYSVTGISSAGCSSTATTQVIVTNSPAITVNSSTICSGTSATLIANGVNTFTWSTSASTNSIVVNPNTSTTYTVTGNLTGCPGVSSNTALVTVNPSPTLSVMGSTATCPGIPVSMTVTGADSYLWDAGSTSSTIAVSPTATTVYTVTGFSLNGCTATLTRTISTAGGPPLTISSTSSVLCAGKQATLSATGASNYTWSTGGTGSIIAVSPSNTTVFTATGAIGSCKGSLQFTQTVDPCTGISDAMHDVAFTFFPNPAHDELTVTFDETNEIQIEFINALGQVLLSTTCLSNSMTIELNNYPRGIYFIAVNSSTTRQTRKVVLK